MTYYNRISEATLREALAIMPAVFLNGPRQAGKSTLVQHLAGTFFPADYVTFDDVAVYAIASHDPEGFLRHFARPVILDEVQRVPEIFRALKLLIDEHRAKGKAQANGRFLLTGSANIMALPELANALVGRMAVLSLYPLSAGEAMGDGAPVINGWFDQEIAFSKGADTSREKISVDEIIHRATFPEITGASRSQSALWFDGYLTTLLQRDVRDLAEIEKIPALPNIVKILAARAGGLLNDADCARDAKLNPMTYRRYRTLLQQLFLIMLVPPWYRNIGKRLVKSPKLFFTDTALLCHQLGVDVTGLSQQNPGLFGHVLENFVASELTKQMAALSDGALYHFRTQDDKEVDFIIERRNGALLGIEVKARSAVTPDDFTGLKVLKKQVGKDFVRGIVLYTGKDTIPFGDDMVAMPLDSLWTFNMKVSTDRDIRYSSDLMSYIFWAQYGDRTRIRCVVPQDVMNDHFLDKATPEQHRSSIIKHWNIIWPLFIRKITGGDIKVVRHEGQSIRQVILESQDFGRQDFRKP